MARVSLYMAGEDCILSGSLTVQSFCPVKAAEDAAEVLEPVLFTLALNMGQSSAEEADAVRAASAAVAKIRRIIFFIVLASLSLLRV